jgi:hypothetical protein
MVGHTSFENIKTLMTLPTSTRWFCLSPKNIRCGELTVGSYQGSMLMVLNILSKSHSGTEHKRVYSDGDGYKEGLRLTLVSQQWPFSISACAD